MKTLYLTYKAGLTVDSENNTVSEMKSTRNAVGDVYLITEDMQVITGNSVLQGDTEKYTEPKKGNVFQVIYALFKAVRNHSMFKQEDLLEGLNMQKNKYLIYPSKRGRHFLACGFLGGFSGFFKKEFREHDYQLGRKNTQTFLRYYFGENIADFSKIGIEFNEFQKNVFGYYPDRDNSKPIKLPLIPDMLLLEELSPNENQTFNKKGKKEISSPDFLGLTSLELNDIVKKIDFRIF